MVQKSFEIRVFKFSTDNKEICMFDRIIDLDPSLSIPYESIESVLHLLFGKESYVMFKTHYYGKSDSRSKE